MTTEQAAAPEETAATPGAARSLDGLIVDLEAQRAQAVRQAGRAIVELQLIRAEAEDPGAEFDPSRLRTLEKMLRKAIYVVAEMSRDVAAIREAAEAELAARWTARKEVSP